jgi:hypothetical protein
MASPTSQRADPTTRFAGSIRADCGTRRYGAWRRGAEGKVRDAKTEPGGATFRPLSSYLPSQMSSVRRLDLR